MVELKRNDRRIETGVDRMQNRAAHRHAVMAFQHRRRIGQQGPTPCRRARCRCWPTRKPIAATAHRTRHNCAATRHGRSRCDQERRWPRVPERSAASAADSSPGCGPDRCCRGLRHGSGILPLGRAFFDEGTDAFFGIAGQHVLDHHARGVIIGLGQGHLALRVEGALSGGECHAGFGRDLARHLHRGLAAVPRGQRRG